MTTTTKHETVNGEPSWSPIQSLPQASLTASGLLVLDTADGEVELLRRDAVELRSDTLEPLPNPGMGGAWVDRNVNLALTLTTHRVFFANAENHKYAWFLHHSNVHNLAQAGGGISFKSPKVVVSTYALGDLLLCFRGNNAAKDRDDLFRLYQKSLDRKAWESTERLDQKQRTSNQIAARKVGVDAIFTKNALRHKEAAQLTESAFLGDADTLLQEAAELVKIIEKYVSTLESSGEGQGQAQLTDMLSNMGMASALSRDQVRGNDFYQLLARQLADFLLPKLKVSGGVMTLTDVYCLYNRARGTNLISPEDLLAASSLLADLKLGMSLRSFPSGVQVIQQDAFDDAKMAQKLLQLSLKQPLTSLQVSRDLHIPSLLAQEQLLAAERLGFLCRDVTLETTRFYPNRFKDFC
jgi:ESCRT-II complex subunit VPS36